MYIKHCRLIIKHRDANRGEWVGGGGESLRKKGSDGDKLGCEGNNGITTVKILSGSICPARNKSTQTGDAPGSEAEEEDVTLQSSARKVTKRDSE